VQVPVEVLPRPRLNLQAVVGSKDSAQLVFRRPDGRALSLTDPVSRVGAWVEFELEPIERGTRLDNGLEVLPGDVVLTARVRPDASPIRRNGTLQLRSNHPQMAVVTVPVTVRVRPTIEIRPTEVRLVGGTSRPGTGSTIVQIVHNRGREFRVSDVRSGHPDIVQAGSATGGARSVHNVWIRLTESAAGDATEFPLRADVVVTLDGVETRTVTIPVVVSMR
jgi:hypothetical protein